MKTSLKNFLSVVVTLTTLSLTFLDQVSAQTAASATWALTSTGNASTSGNVTATAISIGGGINSLSHAASGASSGSWSNDAGNLVNDEYYQYNISPNSGNNLTVTSITGSHSVSNGDWIAAIYYSTDGFTTQTQIGSNIASVTNTESNFSSTSLSISVANGQTLSIRIFAWDSDDRNRSYRNKNIVISGTTTGIKQFRSVASGNFNSTSTWEQSTDNGSTWVSATSVPSATDGTVTVSSGYTVTVGSNVSSDQVVINSGGIVNVSTGITWTIQDGSGTDLNVQGKLNVDGTILNYGSISSTSSTLEFKSGSIYQHNVDGGTVPASNWNNTSTCQIIGVIDNTVSGLGQSFGNFTWNCPNQDSDRSLPSSDFLVNGMFSVINTNDRELRMSQTPISVGSFYQEGGIFRVGTNTKRTLNILGSFSLVGGTLNLSSGDGSGGSGTYGGTINVKGNYTHTAGTLTESGSNNGGIVFNGSSAQTITGGGTISNVVNFEFANTHASGVSLLTNYNIPSNLNVSSGVLDWVSGSNKFFC